MKGKANQSLVYRRGCKAALTSLVVGLGVSIAAPPALGQQTQDVANASPTESTAVASAALTKAEFAEIAARVAYARSIVDKLRPEAAANAYSPGWDVSLTSRLYNRNSKELAAISSLGTYAQVSSAMAGATRAVPILKDHGYGTNNLVFHPISPCRLLDTRNAVGTLPANTTRVVDMNNSATQGGASACSGTIQLADPGIGGNSAWGALAVNITVANTGPGPAFLRVRPVGSTNTTSFLNWSTAGSQVANAGIVQLADVALNGQFEMLASSSTDVIIDVFGAFGRTNQMTCSNVFNTTATTLNPGSFVFLNDTDIVACPAGAVAVGFVWHYLTGSGGMAPWENQPGDSNGGLGFTHVPPAPGNAGSAITFNPGRRCCSIPNVTQ